MEDNAAIDVSVQLTPNDLRDLWRSSFIRYLIWLLIAFGIYLTYVVVAEIVNEGFSAETAPTIIWNGVVALGALVVGFFFPPVSSLANDSVRSDPPRTSPIFLLRPRRSFRCGAYDMGLPMGGVFQHCREPKVVFALPVSALRNGNSQSTFCYNRRYQSPSRSILKLLQREAQTAWL